MLENEKEKVNSFIAPYFNMIKPYMTAVAIVIVGLIGWQGYKAYLNYKSINAQSEIEKQKKIVKDLTESYNKLIEDKKVIAEKNVILEQDAAFWKKKATSVIVIPPTPEPPKDLEIVIKDLKYSGVEFAQLSDSIFTTEKGSLPKIWTWSKDSLRIPGLEEKVYTFSIALDKSELLVGGLQKEISVANAALVTADTREVARVKQQDAFEQNEKVMKKQIRAEKINGWLKLGGGMVAGYFVGKQLKK